MDFKGKTALITGASSGIGEEFARQLYASGADLVLTARRKDRLEKLAEELRAGNLGRIEILAADLTDQSDLDKVARYVQDNRIDILINNAGFGSFGRFDELSPEHELKMIQLNITAFTKIAHSVIPQMKGRGAGAIVAVSSVAGFQPLPFMATYSATKAFNLWHSIALRQELNDFGIRVLTVCPGPTETEFFGAVRVGGTITGVRRDPVRSVVSESLRALKRNKGYVVTGMRSKFMAFLVNILPFSVTTRIIKSLFLRSIRESRKV